MQIEVRTPKPIADNGELRLHECIIPVWRTTRTHMPPRTRRPRLGVGEDATVAETFKKHRFTDRVDSSAGWTVRLRRDRVEYIDQLGTVAIEAEWTPMRVMSVRVFPSTATVDSGRRDEALRNMSKAFDAAGWVLKVWE